MAGSLNKVLLIGNLVADPEIRRTQDGKAIANLRLATSESWKDKATGERKEKAEFHRVVIFNEGLAKVAEQYCRKGQKLYIEGQIQTRKWTDKDSIERYSTEVVLNGYGGVLTMLDKAPERDEQPEPDRGNSYAEATGKAQPIRRPVGAGNYSDMDDDIPFGAEVR